MSNKLDLFSWCVGFWEGEGSVELHSRAKGQPKQYLALNAPQNYREPLERLEAVFGGTIGGPYKTGSPYRWYVGGQDAWLCAERMLPYLSERRRMQLQAAMNKAIRTHRCELCGGAMRPDRGKHVCILMEAK